VTRYVDAQVKALLVARLRARRAAGELTSAEVRDAARETGIGERTLWRWLGTTEPPPRRARGDRYEITEADRDAYAAWHGNIAAVHRALHAGRGGPSLRRLQAAFTRDLTPGERAAMVEGVEGRRRHEVYLRWAPNRRNALWEGDHTELPVLVIAPRAQRPRKPWATLFIDGYSRLIMGWALSVYPTSAVVLAALRQGMVVDAARGPFGGLPEALRPDNGLEFVATALARSCAALGVELLPTPPYTPHRKGKIERVNRTLDQEFLSGLPFYTHGPRGADGRLFGPDVEPLSLELFSHRFAEWITDYNTVRVHSELDGQTPQARWCEDATPLREIEPEALRWMLMADVERTINKDGVHFERVRFIAPELNGLVGERVQVRYTPHDLRQIEIFRGDTWLCTAYPQDQLTAEQRAAVLARRHADAAELGRRQRRASRQARARLAPITAPGQAEDVTVITTEQARRERRGRDDDGREMRRLGRTDLLGLHRDFDYWNRPARGSRPTPALDGAPAATSEDGTERTDGDEKG
jgi:Mu transposase, C-terminal./Integrase core domain.